MVLDIEEYDEIEILKFGDGRCLIVKGDRMLNRSGTNWIRRNSEYTNADNCKFKNYRLAKKALKGLIVVKKYKIVLKERRTFVVEEVDINDGVDI